MTRPRIVALLVAAAFAVGIQNYIFFSNQPGALRAVEEDDEEYWDEDEEQSGTPLATVPRASIQEWRDQRATRPRNPFLTVEEIAGLGGNATQTARPRLTGTLWSHERKVAWINGRPHSEGEWVGDRVLESIAPESVVLRRGIEVWTLGLNEAAPAPNEATNDDE